MNVGVVAVVERDGKVLLGKRIHDKHGKGEFWMPGGKPDPGESPAQAVARELLEEAGLTALYVNPLGLWHYSRWEQYQIHCVTLYFMVTVADDDEPVNLEPEKCAGWDWYSPHWLPSPMDLHDLDVIARVL